MPVRGHRRLVLLFLLAILLPALVLVAMGIRTLRQEKELAEKRLEEERRNRLSELRSVLLSELERLGREPKGGAVVLAATVDARGRLVLPWEEGPKSPIDEPEFAAAMSEGENVEFGGDSHRAAAIYRLALRGSRDSTERAYALLLLARALARSGQREQAQAAYREILGLSSDLDDELGVPFFLYGARQLLEAGLEREAILARLRNELSIHRWWSPPATYLLRDLMGRFPGVPAEGLRDFVEVLEQALALQRDFPTLPRDVWAPYGSGPWLVRVDETVLAVRPARVLDGRPAWAGVTFLSGDRGDLLGSDFPGLRVTLPPADDSLLERQWAARNQLWMSALALVVCLTLFGGYLLWRDVRRELRLADLRSHFVSSVSHELKTPLTSIRMFAETLRMGRLRDPRVQDEYLETIVNESERLTRLLGDVLDFSLLEQGKKTYRFRSVRLGDVVRAAVRTLEHPLARQGFELRVELEKDETIVRADSDAIEQALLNLLTNAVKYSGESREIGLSATTEEGRAVIRVSDRGIGIPENEKARIFEKFYRAPTPENERIPGAGLGLTLVERVARAHGGEIHLESVPGGGSTFSLSIPLELDR